MKDYLTEAFLQVRERIAGLSKRTLYDASSSEDVLQEAFVRLWGRYRILSEHEAEALLYRTVRNLSIDRIRRERSTPLDEVPNEPETTEAVDKEALFLKVEALLQNDITDIQRFIIHRHEYEGTRLNVIAKELGMTPAAVRMQLSRARKTIRDKYNEQELL